MIRYFHGRWHHLQALPTDIGKYGGLSDITCPTAGFCVLTTLRGALFTFEQGAWGSAQRLVVHLGDVECSSATHCVASAGHHTLVYDGHSWRKRAGVPRVLDYGGPDCAGKAFCLGTYNAAAYDVAELHHTLWGRLVGVHPGVQACATPTFCVAEAYSQRFDQGTRFEETFNGSAVRRSTYQAARAIACTPGPMCIELTKYSARVGRR
jgi:hypothetical protein